MRPTKTLEAKQVRPYEKMICSLTGEVLYCGDWYYEEDGKIILYEAYHQRKEDIKKAEYDYSNLENIYSAIEYKNMLKEYEKIALENNLDEHFMNELKK